MRGADYVVKRTGFAVVTVLVAVTLNFILFRLAPGSAVSNLSRVPHATQETRNALKRQFGLDKSRGEQYVIYLRELVHGNLGVSFQNSQPVWKNLKSDLGNTIPMVLLGTVFSIVLGTLTGVIAAWRRGTPVEHATVTTALAFYSMPTHWLALMLVILFAGWFPSGGMQNDFLIDPTWFQHVKDVLHHMTLPALTLGLVLYGQYTLIVRSAMLETLGEDYILTARAKGLRPWTIVRRHALRNALLPISTLIALSLGYKRGAGGIRVADGHKMSYAVITPSDLTGVDRTFQIIQADFKKIGVNLTQKALDSSAAFDAITAPGTKYLNFDLAMWDWVPLIDPDFMLSVVTCDQYNGWSDSGYCDKAYDAMYQKQGTTLDQKERKLIVYQMQEKLAHDRPYIFLNYESWISAHSKGWDGFVNSPQGPFNSLSKQSLTEVHKVS